MYYQQEVDTTTVGSNDYRLHLEARNVVILPN